MKKRLDRDSHLALEQRGLPVVQLLPHRMIDAAVVRIRLVERVIGARGRYGLQLRIEDGGHVGSTVTNEMLRV